MLTFIKLHLIDLLISGGLLSPIVYLLTQKAKEISDWFDSQPAWVKQAWVLIQAAGLNALAAWLPGVMDGSGVIDINHVQYGTLVTALITMAIHGNKKSQ